MLCVWCPAAPRCCFYSNVCAFCECEELPTCGYAAPHRSYAVFQSCHRARAFAPSEHWWKQISTPFLQCRAIMDISLPAVRTSLCVFPLYSFADHNYVQPSRVFVRCRLCRCGDLIGTRHKIGELAPSAGAARTERPASPREYPRLSSAKPRTSLRTLDVYLRYA